MTAAPKIQLPPRPLPPATNVATAPQAPGSGVGVIGGADAEIMLAAADLQSLAPAPPPLRVVPASPAVPADLASTAHVADLARLNSEHASLSLELEGDEEMLALIAQKRRRKIKTLLVCLAFPVVIGLVLFSLAGEGHAKDHAIEMLAPAIVAGDNVAINIKRDAAELAAAKKELADAEKEAAKQALQTKQSTKGNKGLRRYR